ncbi:MAG: hypothetical protein JNK87_04570 [Bryobacterales bacterium]|nr:hypothetical protein [Bryobacterales bacterium]
MEGGIAGGHIAGTVAGRPFQTPRSPPTKTDAYSPADFARSLHLGGLEPRNANSVLLRIFPFALQFYL